MSPRILVVAATARELAPPGDWHAVTCGVGPVEAAVRSTRAIADHAPAAVLHVGIAGIRRQRTVPPGTLVVGTRAVYHDLGHLPPEWAPREVTPPLPLLEALRAHLPQAVFAPIGTSARVGGTLAPATVGQEGTDHGIRGHEAGRDDVVVEAMEGFAVLRAAQLAGVPAIEVRAISNDIEEADRARWHFATAFSAITAMTPELVTMLRQALSDTPSHA